MIAQPSQEIREQFKWRIRREYDLTHHTIATDHGRACFGAIHAVSQLYPWASTNDVVAVLESIPAPMAARLYATWRFEEVTRSMTKKENR